MSVAIMIPGVGLDVPLDVVVLGVITGLSYGLAAVALTLVYRAARVINFSFGEMGALPAGLLAVLVARYHWPYTGALLAALAVAVVLGGVAHLLLMERLATAPRLVVLVGTIGLGQVFLALTLFLPLLPPGTGGYPTPFSTSFTVGNLILTPGHLLVVVVAPAAMLGVVAFLRHTTVGMAVQAFGNNPDAARLVGVRTRRVSMIVWVLVSMLAAVSAILVSGVTAQVGQQQIGPQVLLPALAAALIGRLTDIPQAFAAGIGIGVVSAVTTWNYPAGGMTELVLLVIVVTTLLIRRGLSESSRGGEETTWTLGGSVRALNPELLGVQRTRLVRLAALAAVGIVAVAVPLMSNSHVVLAASVALFALMGLSVVVITGFAGQVSLAQFAFVGLGAIVGGRVAQLGYPVGVQIVYVAVVGGLAALLIGVPALRVRGLYLAVSSLAFAVAANSWVLRQDWLVRTDLSGDSLRIPRAEVLGIDLRSERAYYYVCLGALVLGIVLVRRMRVTGFGRVTFATRDNELSAQSMTVAPRRAKLKAFVFSGVIAAVAGYLYGGLLVSFGRVGLFDPSLSLGLVAMVIFGGVSTSTGAVLGALYVRGIPYFFGPTWGILATGAGLLVALQLFPDGLASVGFRLRDRLLSRFARGTTSTIDADERLTLVRPTFDDPVVGASAAPPTAPALAVKDLTVAFGGVVAVDHVDLDFGQGEIVALVGPNGAGKTTLFDAITGHAPVATGSVSLAGLDITDLRPEARAQLGIGRTFQQARLFPEMPLLDAVRVALEAHWPAEAVPSLLGLPPVAEPNGLPRRRHRSFSSSSACRTMPRRSAASCPRACGASASWPASSASRRTS